MRYSRRHEKYESPRQERRESRKFEREERRMGWEMPLHEMHHKPYKHHEEKWEAFFGEPHRNSFVFGKKKR
jgi:hypothetical protein